MENEQYIFGVDPFAEKPEEPAPKEPAPKEPAPAQSQLSFGPSPFEPVSPTEAFGAQVVRPLTPKAMGRYLEQRMLPSLEEEKIKAETERQKRIPEAKAILRDKLSERDQKVLAFGGNLLDTATLGLASYLPALGLKGASYFDPSLKEKMKNTSIVGLKKSVQKIIEAASTLQPGWGVAGTAGGILGGARVLPPIARSRGPAVSGAATGALYGGVAGVASEGDLYDAIKGATVGAVGGAVAAPLIERATSGLIRAFVGGKPVVDAGGQLTAEAISVARKAGLNDQQIAQLQPQLRQVFEQRGLTQSAAREAPFREFGVTPTRGMVTKDPKQLAREKEFGTLGVTAEGAPVAAERITGGAPQRTISEAVEDAVASGNRNAAQLKNSYGRAYAAAEAVPGKFNRENISNLGEKIMMRFGSDPKTLFIYSNDLAKKAAADLDAVLGAKIPTEVPGVSVIHTTFRGVEGARQMLNKYLGQGRTNADRSAIRSLIDEFDKRIENNINAGLFSGDARVLSDWRTGRKLYSEYQNKFGVKKTGEDAGRLMSSILDGTKNSDDVAQLMFNISKSGDVSLKAGAVKSFLQLRRGLGARSPELEQLKNSFIQKIIQPTSSGKDGVFLPKDFANVAKNIQDMVSGRGSAFSRRALSDVERQALLRYSDIMKTAALEAPDITRSKILDWVKKAALTAPAAAGAVGWSLMNLDPKLAAALTLVGSTPAAIKGIAGRKFSQNYLANRPPPTQGRPYRFPAVRTAIPLAGAAAPTIDQQIGDIVEEQRPGRATGGSVKGAVNLRALANAARKQVCQSTEDFLKESDDQVAKALEIANQHI
jgi:hypothetical protein